MKVVLGFLLGVIATQAMFIPWDVGHFSYFEWRNDSTGDFRNREEYMANREVCLYRMDTPHGWHTGSEKVGCINRINNLVMYFRD